MSTTKLLQEKLCPFATNTRTEPTKIVTKLPDTYEERLALYQQKLAEHEKEKAEREKAVPGKPLYEHEYEFVDGSGHFSGETVTKELEKVHASGATFKGPIISGFNEGHSGTNGPITLDTDFTEHVHHGTARIFNADGTFNQKNWDDLLQFVKDKQGAAESNIIRLSTFEDFVKMINKRDGFEPETGRRDVITKAVQDMAGTGARQQLFDVLHCGYKETGNGWFTKKDPCMFLSDLELFYKDSKAVFLKAECGLLPINKRIPDPISIEVVPTAASGHRASLRI